MKKTALVTGSTGFFGRHLIKFLKEAGWIIYESNTKIANLNNYENLHIYDNIQFSHIFHLAVKTKAGDWCKYHKGDQWLHNQFINTNILKFWNEKQSNAKMIIFGTSCSYGPSELPMPESDYLIYEPNVDLYTYAMTKRMLYIGCKSLAEQYGLKYVHYIPSTLFGPHFDTHDTHFIFDLIKKITYGKYLGTEVELWGHGYQKRELVYIYDAINIVMKTLHLENETINIGSGNDYSIREYANIISSILGYDSSLINYNTEKFIGVNRKVLSIDKLNTLIPDLKFTPLNESMQTTIDYFLNNNFKETI